jgi:nucleoside-diphosphate-sugar epimerase
MQAEYAINSAVDENFHPIIFRQATVYGWSPRMRFDLVVNTMTKYGVISGKLRANSPDLWRPLIHIRDLVEAYVLALGVDSNLTGTFNIAQGNFTILQIANEVQSALYARGVECQVDKGNDQDLRNYRVSTEKVGKILGFKAALTVKDGVNELLDKVGNTNTSVWTDNKYINAEVYKTKVLQEEKNYKLWKKFLHDINEDTDKVKPQNWHQEGP